MHLFTGLFLGSVVFSLLLFDLVLWKQHKDHIEQWRLDGCPWGFFKFSREAGFWRGCMARGVVFKRWLFDNPAWLDSDPVATRYIYLFRIMVALSCVGWAFVLMLMIKTA